MGKKEILKIANTELDRRIKLTPEQRDEIKDLGEPFEIGANNKSPYSIHSLAKRYGVSRRLISSIVKDKPIKQYTYNDKKNFPSSSTKYRTNKTTDHRQYKKSLLRDGIIDNNGVILDYTYVREQCNLCGIEIGEKFRGPFKLLYLKGGGVCDNCIEYTINYYTKGTNKGDR